MYFNVREGGGEGAVARMRTDVSGGPGSGGAISAVGVSRRDVMELVSEVLESVDKEVGTLRLMG